MELGESMSEVSYQGVIIEESLADKSVLDDVEIVSTQVAAVTPRHKTPWLKQWTLHTVAIPPEAAGKVAEKLKSSLIGDDETGSWYADFKNDSTHYIIFPGKIFKIDRTKAAQYQAATTYGISLGIPDYQLNFDEFVITGREED
jgi:hypothetical protein